MSYKILTVEDSFEIKGRCLLFVGTWDEKMPGVSVGAKVRIVRPDKSEIFTRIELVECQIKRPAGEKYLVLVFEKGIGKADVPVNSAVYLS